MWNRANYRSRKKPIKIHVFFRRWDGMGMNLTEQVK